MSVKRNIETTFSARVMRWGGVLLVVFIIFHLLHLTAGAVGFHAGQFRHLAVYQNVTQAFTVWPVALFYVVAMGALCLHLDHGIWSMLQTLGWNTARNEKNSEDRLTSDRDRGLSWIQLSSGLGLGRLVALIADCIIEGAQKCWKPGYRQVQLSRSGTTAATR